MSDSDKHAWTIRRARLSDGSQIAKLEGDHPDSGPLSISYHYRYNALAVQEALRPGSVCLVATIEDRIVGMGFYEPSMGRVRGELRFVGTIYGLVVHSEFRMRGIGSGIYAALVEHIRSAGGPDSVIVAGVQSGNEGSRKAARNWAKQELRGRIRVMFRAGRARAPKLPRSLAIRGAVDADWGVVTEGLNSCYADYELAPTWNEGGLRTFYGATPFGEQLRGYLVATNEDDRIVAGIGGVFDGSVQTGHLKKLPLLVRMIGAALHLLPRDGILRRVICRDAWYSRGMPGGAEGLAALWKFVAWEWRTRGNNFLMFTDPEGHISDALRHRSLVPIEGGWLMVASDPEIDASHPLWLPM